jgi:hypothetical protein
MGEVVRVWKADGELEWGEELVPVLWILLHLASTEGGEAPGEESTVRSFEKVLLCTSDWKRLILYWTKAFQSEEQRVRVLWPTVCKQSHVMKPLLGVWQFVLSAYSSGTFQLDEWL